MSLHNEIMNLPSRVNRGYSHEYQGGYKFGHRDARHAAAELAGAREAELVRVIKGLLHTAPDPADFQHDGDFVNAVEAAREAVKRDTEH